MKLCTLVCISSSGGPVESVRQRLYLLLLKHEDAISRNKKATQNHAGEVQDIATALLELIKETEGLQNDLTQVHLASLFDIFTTIKFMVYFMQYHSYNVDWILKL